MVSYHYRLSLIIVVGTITFTCALCGKHHELFSISFSDFQRDLFHILCLLKDLLVDPKCSADGRDNAIGLIAKNVPRTDIREGTNQRVMAFLGIDGKLMTICISLSKVGTPEQVGRAEFSGEIR